MLVPIALKPDAEAGASPFDRSQLPGFLTAAQEECAVCYSVASKEHGNLKGKVREGGWEMSHKLWRGRRTERL